MMGDIDLETVGTAWLASLLIGVVVVGVFTLFQQHKAIKRVEGLADELVQLRERVKERDFELTLYKKTDGMEHQRRVYYQNIVYAVAREFDTLLQRQPGNGLVCGTIESPASQVEEVAAYLVGQLRTMPGIRTKLMLTFPPPVAGDAKPNYWVKYVPGFVDVEPTPLAPFGTREEFLALATIAKWRADPRFERFVQAVEGTQTILSADLEDTRYVVGLLSWPVPESWLEKSEDAAIKAETRS